MAKDICINAIPGGQVLQLGSQVLFLYLMKAKYIPSNFDIVIAFCTMLNLWQKLEENSAYMARCLVAVAYNLCDKPKLFSGNNYLEGDEIKRFVLDLMQRAGHQLTEDQIDNCISVSWIWFQ